MKKSIILIILLFVVNMSFAQKKYDRMRSFKTAYLTEKLELTPQEAERFWPLYNESEKKLWQLRKKNKDLIRTLKSDDGSIQISDGQNTDKILSELMKNDRDMQKEKESMYKEVKDVLSSEKLLKLYIAEAEFNKHLLKEYRKRGPGKP